MYKARVPQFLGGLLFFDTKVYLLLLSVSRQIRNGFFLSFKGNMGRACIHVKVHAEALGFLQELSIFYR